MRPNYREYTSQELWSLGYQEIQLPIVPPDAPVGAALADAVARAANGKGKDPRGKAPARLSGGVWYGFVGWETHLATGADIASWAAWGAGTGLRMGACGAQHLAFIDVDTMIAKRAETIHKIITKALDFLNPHPAPMRIGRDPRRGYLVRLDQSCVKTYVTFGEGADSEKLEVLCTGSQFVAIGTHQLTRLAYHWPTPLVPIDELPLLTIAQLQELLEQIARALPNGMVGCARPKGSTHYDQADLKGNIDRVRKAMLLIPNNDDFKAREAWVNIGYAIRAACDDDAVGAELFLDWSMRWTCGANDHDLVLAQFHTFNGPYRRGAGWLHELAEHYAGKDKFDAQAADAADLADRFFDAEAAAEARAEEAKARAKAEAAAGEHIEILDTAAIDALRPPRYLIDRIVPAGTVGFLWGDSRGFKTFLALDMSLTLAYRLADWHGHVIRPRGNGAVVYVVGEGASGIGKRIRAWRIRHNIAADAPNRFYAIREGINLLSAESRAKIGNSIRAIVKVPIDLIVFDTVATSTPGAEDNTARDIGLFIAGCREFGKAFDAAVAGIHHPTKNGESMRGSGAFFMSADFVFHLERLVTEDGIETLYTRLTCEKLKDDEDGWEELYRLERVFTGSGEDSLVPVRAGPDDDINVGAGGKSAKMLKVELVFLKLMEWHEKRHVELSHIPTAHGYYAVSIFTAHPGREGLKKADFMMAMHELISLEQVEVYDTEQRKDRQTIRIRMTDAGRSRLATRQKT